MPVRILHIVTYMGRGGLETFLMNCYRSLDKSQFQFDFLVHRPFQADYDEEIRALGGRIYRIRPLNPLHPGYYRGLISFFRSHPEYRIVHCHLDCMSALPLSAAKACGIPVRIAHAHSSCQDRDWKYPLKSFFRLWIPKFATHLFACSHAAGAWTFPNQLFSILHNGINPELFRYDPTVRTCLRESMNAEEKYVIGHVGRFAPAKNHRFLLEIFAKLHTAKPNACLLLVGDGPLRESLQQQVVKYGLQDSVCFAGIRDDTANWYQAMDLFVFPSLYEGFGMAALEAQASGLPCVLSDTIPADCIVTDCVTRLSLTASADEWAEHILALPSSKRESRASEIRSHGFDISQTVETLQDFYRKAGA